MELSRSRSSPRISNQLPATFFQREATSSNLYTAWHIAVHLSVIQCIIIVLQSSKVCSLKKKSEVGCSSASNLTATALSESIRPAPRSRLNKMRTREIYFNHAHWWLVIAHWWLVIGHWSLVIAHLVENLSKTFKLGIEVCTTAVHFINLPMKWSAVQKQPALDQPQSQLGIGTDIFSDFGPKRLPIYINIEVFWPISQKTTSEM